MGARVAVLLATYNDGDLLFRALDSVLRSSIELDIFVIDDASLVKVEIPNEFAPRVFLVRLNENVGLTKALNVGLHSILEKGYEYVARMDADDISLDGRFEEQVAFLDLNKDVGGVSVWARFFKDTDGSTSFYFKPPCNPNDVRQKLFINSPLLHPGWMFRSSVYKEMGGYNESYPVAQDYEFLVRSSKAGIKFANIPKVLIDYQISAGGISVKRRRRQLSARLSIQLSLFRFSSFSSWYGLVKTVLLFTAPMSLIEYVKQRSKRYA